MTAVRADILSVLGVLSSTLGIGRSVRSLVGIDDALVQHSSLVNGNTVLQRPGTDLSVLLALGARRFAGAARLSCLALVGRCMASVFDVRRESLVELVCMLVREIDDVLLSVPVVSVKDEGDPPRSNSLCGAPLISLLLCQRLSVVVLSTTDQQQNATGGHE